MQQTMKESVHGPYTFSSPVISALAFEVNREFDMAKYGTVPMTSKGMTRKTGDRKAVVELEVMLGGQSAADPFSMKVAMASEFSWKEALAPERESALLTKEAPALLLSYIRPLAAQVTLQSGLPAFTIPPMDFSGEAAR